MLSAVLSHSIGTYARTFSIFISFKMFHCCLNKSAPEAAHIFCICGLKLLYREHFAIKYVVVDCSNIANLFRVVVVYYTFTWNFGLSVVQHVVYVTFISFLIRTKILLSN